jgi:very-short-patch-repair endonuclease
LSKEREKGKIKTQLSKKLDKVRIKIICSPSLAKEGVRGRLVFMQNTYNITNTEIKRKELRKNSTEEEKKLWQYLRNRQFEGLKFYRQYGIGSYIADFYCPSLKLVIELDGSQHFTEDGLEYDKIREEFMNSLGIKTIRFNNNDVMTNIEGVLEGIKNHVDTKN